MTNLPAYWMRETSGVLRPAVEAYLRGEPMSEAQIAALRAYLRQWITADVWYGRDVDDLRAEIDSLTSRAALDAWLGKASRYGIDPI